MVVFSMVSSGFSCVANQVFLPKSIFLLFSQLGCKAADWNLCPSLVPVEETLEMAAKAASPPFTVPPFPNRKERKNDKALVSFLICARVLFSCTRRLEVLRALYLALHKRRQWNVKSF